MTDARQSVLRAALALVDSGGLDAVTITALTERSGVSNGSIYHHFGSRSGVFAALYVDSFGRCVDAMLPALDDRPACEVVPDVVLRYLDWIAENPSRARFLYTAPATADVEEKARLHEPVQAWFAERMAAGELRPLPPWALDPIAMGPAHEFVRRHLMGAFSLADARLLVADAVWRVVRP